MDHFLSVFILLRVIFCLLIQIYLSATGHLSVCLLCNSQNLSICIHNKSKFPKISFHYESLMYINFDFCEVAAKVYKIVQLLHFCQDVLLLNHSMQEILSLQVQFYVANTYNQLTSNIVKPKKLQFLLSILLFILGFSTFQSAETTFRLKF